MVYNFIKGGDSNGAKRTNFVYLRVHFHRHNGSGNRLWNGWNFWKEPSCSHRYCVVYQRVPYRYHYVIYMKNKLFLSTSLTTLSLHPCEEKKRGRKKGAESQSARMHPEKRQKKHSNIYSYEKTNNTAQIPLWLNFLQEFLSSRRFYPFWLCFLCTRPPSSAWSTEAIETQLSALYSTTEVRVFSDSIGL